jgi:outer membrane protein OmpA-like peptidoglycan-associated protein
MKKVIIAFLIAVHTAAFAQDTTANLFDVQQVEAPVNKVLGQLKTANNHLPQWAVDISYKNGVANSNATMMASNYNSMIAEMSKYPSSLKDNGLRYQGVNAQLIYFFGKNKNVAKKFKSRQWGIGVGVNYNWYTGGNYTLNDFIVHYKSIDNAPSKDTFRQIIRDANNTLNETYSITNINIPLVLKYKTQFRKSPFGFAVDAGPVFGLNTVHKYSVDENLIYEAIYKRENGAFVYNNATSNIGLIGNGNTSYTIAHWEENRTSDADINAFFSDRFNSGYNISNNTNIVKSGSNGVYKTIPNIGFTIAPSLTYQVTHYVQFMVGAFYTYQVFNNKPSDTYLLTDKVGDYNSLANGIKSNIIMNYGGQVGLRIFFGEKPDRDADGILDINDNCFDRPGVRNCNGCPDSDGDGVQDNDDECPSTYGTKDAGGCPDADDDGIKDADDNCKDEKGEPEFKGCTEEEFTNKFILEKNMIKAPTEPLPVIVTEKYIEITKSYLNFKFREARILEENDLMLVELTEILTKNENVIAIVSGYTDNVGTPEANLKLSQIRAAAVRNYLISKGVSEDRIIAVGYGFEKPVASNDNEEGRSANRRSEIRLVQPIKTKSK